MQGQQCSSGVKDEDQTRDLNCLRGITNLPDNRSVVLCIAALDTACAFGPQNSTGSAFGPISRSSSIWKENCVISNNTLKTNALRQNSQKRMGVVFVEHGVLVFITESCSKQPRCMEAGHGRLETYNEVRTPVKLKMNQAWQYY